jgi:K(+)-stimulated pyrophosphate-energized sodium pump
VMNLVSLLIATSVVKYSGDVGLRTGVALGAVVIIVGAIVYSKRRQHGGLGDEEAPASASAEGAAIEASVPAPTGDGNALEAVPSSPAAHEDGSLNGHATAAAPSVGDPPAE